MVSPATAMVLEAENGTLTGNCHVTTAVSGYSGTGYVTGFQSANDTVNWSFTGTPGLYDLLIRYRSPYGPKGYAGVMDGHGFSGMFPSNSVFASFDAGLVQVVAGVNTLQIGGSWNYYEIDRVDLNSVPTPPPPAP
ncbi:MAG TPA: CBM35 domain-containing protein, partial [Verrucomicrobiae bacterium]|nr:CBM35 domain-containing protein [Verrucomicrobiae bacterium]